jgi:hypothetical protein
VEKSADEQGLMRGVEQSKVEADGGPLLEDAWPMAQRERQGGASRTARVLQDSTDTPTGTVQDGTGLGNACCGDSLLLVGGYGLCGW